MKRLFLILCIPVWCFGNSDSLEITRFYTRTGVIRSDSVWNPKGEIVLNVPPVFVSISLKEEPGQNLVCILTDTLTLYDTLYLGVNPTVNFFNLPGGNYTARFVDLSNGATAVQKFEIKSSFWQRWWFPPFILLVFTLVIGIVFYYIYKIRLRQQLHTQLIRDNIARDLHDDIGSYLGSISILSQSIDILMAKNPDKARLSIGKIGDTARLIMDTMGDIVWSINSNHDSMPMVIQRMRDLASELLSEQGIVTDFVIDESIQKLSLTLDKRRDFYLIYKEAVTNIQKYARATRVEIAVRKEENDVLLTVKDNGAGFDVSDPGQRKSNGGNGLVNMDARARRLGGTLTITSKPGEGTTLNFSFKI
ncbi:sensor histidine kinase [Leadbetterella sp. DM7]|uniref:sensor histidine kinase n=1 Tax=Leadbetterella sp. DM7 TaxID=3235085 RepID=UPI00349E8D37